MIYAVAFLGVFCATLFVVSMRLKGRDHTFASILGGLRMMRSILTLFLLALLVAGFLEVVVPPELIQHWLGEKAGARGYITSMVAGIILPGGPYVTFPIISAVYRAGMALGPAVTFVTAWAVLGFGLAIFEMTFVGIRFMLIRIALVFWVPVAAGLLAQFFFG